MGCSPSRTSRDRWCSEPHAAVALDDHATTRRHTSMSLPFERDRLPSDDAYECCSHRRPDQDRRRLAWSMLLHVRTRMSFVPLPIGSGRASAAVPRINRRHQWTACSESSTVRLWSMNTFAGRMHRNIFAQRRTGRVRRAVMPGFVDCGFRSGRFEVCMTRMSADVGAKPSSVRRRDDCLVRGNRSCCPRRPTRAVHRNRNIREG